MVGLVCGRVVFVLGLWCLPGGHRCASRRGLLRGLSRPWVLARGVDLALLLLLASPLRCLGLVVPP